MNKNVYSFHQPFVENNHPYGLKEDLNNADHQLAIPFDPKEILLGHHLFNSSTRVKAFHLNRFSAEQSQTNSNKERVGDHKHFASKIKHSWNWIRDAQPILRSKNMKNTGKSTKFLTHSMQIRHGEISHSYHSKQIRQPRQNKNIYSHKSLVPNKEQFSYTPQTLSRRNENQTTPDPVDKHTTVKRGVSAGKQKRFMSNLKSSLKKHMKNRHGSWAVSQKEADKLFQKYYQCITDRLKLLQAEEFPIKAFMAIEGEKIMMECNVCYRPDLDEASQKAVWQVLGHEATDTHAVTLSDKVKILKDNTLVIKDIDVNDAGQYYCVEQRDYMAIYQLDVFLEDKRRHLRIGIDEPMADEFLFDRNLRVYTTWAPWSECNTCGRPGRRLRVGQCTVNKIYEDLPVFPRDYPLMVLYPEGIPCHSTALPLHIRQLNQVGDRPSETIVLPCLEACPTEPPARIVTDKSGEVLEVLEPGFYPINEKPVIPPMVRRKVLYEPEKSNLVLVCPGSAAIKMEFTKENMRFNIVMRCKLDELANLIHETLQTVCGDCACSYQTVFLWVKEFDEGKESLSDCPRPGRPKSCVKEQTIAPIKKDIDEDPHISVRKLSDTNGLSYGTVHTIITEHLHMEKNVLSQVKSAINEQRPKVSTSRTLLLHDNAGLHKARATTQSLRELGIQVLLHPAYSPDWAPFDF
ncbi:Ig-like V-type domain-containing protein FAM187A [Elysia marginata]|uniref:Ig-like V-type domain-containing protein FAM187A n=1 Tax=Elysia marginata TaxID=1093978 RepID=A0AAV4JEQ5_9GAST|nr:Ig-like V-type domain-containing protein FAM187A [Elysia marginata]